MSLGAIYLLYLPTTVKEYAVRQTLDQIRQYKFWVKEIKDAKTGVALMVKAGQSILDCYRSSHTKDEIEEDTSIIGHLIRGPYKSDRERIADVTIFMLAGHDTTAYQVSCLSLSLYLSFSLSPSLLLSLSLSLSHSISLSLFLPLSFSPSLSLWP
jgi:hypothetical protein